MKNIKSRVSLGAHISKPLLGAVVQDLADGVLMTEVRTDGKPPAIVYANDYLGAMTGYRPDAIIGKDLRLLHGPKAASGPAGARFTNEGIVLCKDGSTFYAAWSGHTVDYQGQKYVIRVYRDMTEVRRLHDAVVHAQKLDAAGQLAGGIAHDFNNLLSVINGYCEILEERLPPGAAQLKEITEIHRAGLQAANLTRQLLAFSRRQPMQVKVISLNDFLQDVTDIITRLIGTGIRFEAKLDKDIANIRVDPSQLQQVVLNLVLNARDAMPKGGRLSVRTWATVIAPGKNRRVNDLHPGRYVVLSVSDSGIGMSEKVKKHLFEPFFTTKESGKGTGLGLAMVYGIVRQSGGYIQVESQPKKGATFDLYLPEVKSPAESATGIVGRLGKIKGSGRVLLIEEDDALSKMIEGLLTANGYVVLVAKTDVETNRILRSKGRVDLLIASLSNARDQDRWVSLAVALAKSSRELKVLDTSAVAEPASIPGLASDAVARLPKPFALSQLLEQIRNLLRDSRMRRK